MSRLNKLQKFSELLSCPNVYENFDYDNPELRQGIIGEIKEMKGAWVSNHFKNQNPLTLELACGRGEYSVALAALFPNRNFIGVDIKGARIWKGATQAIEQNLNNAAFLRTKIEQVALFFDKNEVDEIWITFPDPFVSRTGIGEGKPNRRLTSPMYLDFYRQFLKPGGIVHLKTDSQELYESSMEVLQEDTRCKIIYSDNDIYSKPLYIPELAVKTYYEALNQAKGKTITYIQFTI
jgi:tRNA (guanine-N7-)-methyltransferase